MSVRSPRSLALGAVLVLAIAALPARAPAATVTFRVTVPLLTPVQDRIFVAGDFQGWNPGDTTRALTRQEDGSWTIALDLPPRPIRFKFTRGSWKTVEGGWRGEAIKSRRLTPEPNGAYDFSVKSWRDQADGGSARGTITGHVEHQAFARFLSGRGLWIYLPPGYAKSDDRYPVLYMNDGQNLFDDRTSSAGEWRLDETLERMIARREIAPVIVVGIENAGLGRIAEYTPWVRPGGKPGSGGGARRYLEAIRDTLIPEIDHRYRTRQGRDHVWMAGSSLGGLVSAYAGYEFDGTFSRVAAVSPSYWWADHAMLALARRHFKPRLDRFYQDMGAAEDTSDFNRNHVSDPIDDLRAMRDVAQEQGFVEGKDFRSVEVPGAEHNERFWGARLPEILRFLVGAPEKANEKSR